MCILNDSFKSKNRKTKLKEFFNSKDGDEKRQTLSLLIKQTI